MVEGDSTIIMNMYENIQNEQRVSNIYKHWILDVRLEKLASKLSQGISLSFSDVKRYGNKVGAILANIAGKPDIERGILGYVSDQDLKTHCLSLAYKERTPPYVGADERRGDTEGE